MKKIRKIAMIMLLVFSCTMLGGKTELQAAGGSSTLSLSSSNVNIGDTVTATLKVKTDAYGAVQMRVSYPGTILEYTQASSMDCNGGGGALNIATEVNGSYSITMTFKAKAPGDATISVALVGAYVIETAEAMNISGCSATVTVNNAATGGETPGDTPGGNPGGGNAGENTNQGTLSADNSLKSLKISPGTLSPKFKYSTVNYTATVGPDVTSIAVDAQPSNAKATVESVTGNTNLKVGKNTIKIVVKAENGTLATYTIVVTKEGTVGEEPTTGEIPEGSIEINGINYLPSEKLPEDVLPAEFVKINTVYGDKEIEAYSFPYEDFTLLYLTPVDNQEATGEFYFYSVGRNAFFPYININVGQKYVLLLPSVFAEASENAEIVKHYEESLIVVGKFSVNGYQWRTDKEEGKNEFYLVYGVDSTGATGWYQYDVMDMSVQRHHETTYIEETPEVESTVDAEAYEAAIAEIEKEYREYKINSRTIMAIMVILLAISIIVMICVIVFSKRAKKKRKQAEDDMDFIDFDHII